MTIEIDTSRDSLIDDAGMRRLKVSYMLPSETSPQERFAYVCSKLGSNTEHAQRMYDYVSKHYVAFSTPILSLGKAKHGLPISCYLSYLDDTSEGLLDTQREVNKLSMLGGGVSVCVKIRSSDTKSTGIMPHMKTYDSNSLAYRQDEIRRGSYAMYLDIDHPEIIPFIDMRKVTGDHNVRCHNIHHAVNVPDKFMEIIEKCMSDSSTDDSWPLIDPHTRQIKKIVSAKDLWQRIVDTRMRTGEPYICFIDTCNRYLNDSQKRMGKKIHHSNLCTEITLATDADTTAVCCLSSLNLSTYDEWKDNFQFVKDVAEFLDNALTMFIDNAPERDIGRAIRSVSNERSIGIGAMGFHDYLQSKNIAFESSEAKILNMEIFKNLRSKIDDANRMLGTERGSPPDIAGTGMRFSHTMAIAPNASSSIVFGNTSPSIEPYRACAFRQDTLSGSHLSKNRHLDRLLHEKFSEQKKIERVWSDIILNNGSVQHLDFLTVHEKNVFKTAFEIDQISIIELAADRQQFIDQAQSLNTFLRPDINISTLHLVNFLPWKRGLKTLYYLRSTKITDTDKLEMKPQPSSLVVCARRKPTDDETTECMMCQ